MSPSKYTIDQLPGSSQSQGQRHRGEKTRGVGGSPAEEHILFGFPKAKKWNRIGQLFVRIPKVLKGTCTGTSGRSIPENAVFQVNLGFHGTKQNSGFLDQSWIRPSTVRTESRESRSDGQTCPAVAVGQMPCSYVMINDQPALELKATSKVIMLSPFGPAKPATIITAVETEAPRVKMRDQWHLTQM